MIIRNLTLLDYVGGASKAGSIYLVFVLILVCSVSVFIIMLIIDFIRLQETKARMDFICKKDDGARKTNEKQYALGGLPILSHLLGGHKDFYKEMMKSKRGDLIGINAALDRAKGFVTCK